MNDYFSGLTGRIVTPKDPLYSVARQDYNRAVQQFPLIIDYCRDERDVANAVVWSRKNRVPLRVRNGGHNYEGYSNGDGVLVIDVSGLDRIKIDEEKNLLTVGGGVTNRRVYDFVSSRGYPFPGGTCPTVGVCGYSTGGGWGLSCRYLGLGCDSLAGIGLVNYEGKLIKASRSLNADLFWACRGAGGGNFGVIVSLEFILPRKVDKVTLIEIDYLGVGSQEQEDFLRVWQDWLRGADKRVTLISRIYNSAADGLSMLVRGIFYGGPDEAERLLAPFLALAGADYSFSYVTFLEAVTVIGSVYPPFERFQSASRFVTQDFTSAEIPRLVGLIRERAPGSVFAGLSMYALGGRVSEVGRDETAFFYRGAHFIIWLETVWEDARFAAQNRAWVGRRFPILAAVTTGSYVNFPYRGLRYYLSEYYGAHVPALEKIKRKYDPLDVFTFPQGLRSDGTEIAEPRSDFSDPARGRPDGAALRRFRYVREIRSSRPTDGAYPPVWSFVSSPSLHPMRVNVNLYRPGTAQGLVFVAPYTSYGETMIGQTGALIMDGEGDPVYFRPLGSIYRQNADFRMQYYKGRPALTMWQGTISGTQSANPDLPAGDPEPGAQYLILGQDYKVIKRLTAQKNFTSDLHEFTLTRRNTALFTAVKQVSADLAPYKGPTYGFFDDYSIQEIDLDTGRLVFFWDALDHIDPAYSMLPASSAAQSNNIWDCYHMNSVEEGPGDTLLVSLRNMWAIYLVDKKTGNVLWQLGGQKSDFDLGENAGFSWQHDARFRGENRVSLFDDACCACPTCPHQGPARGLILCLDFNNFTAEVDRTYYHDPLLYVPSQGNLESLYNGNQFVGWGQEPYVSEFAESGNNVDYPSYSFLYDVRFPNQNISYRAFKSGWVGLPDYPPNIAARRDESGAVVFASWNGSTETAAWRVFAGPAPERLSAAAEPAPRTGFETAVCVQNAGPFFRVEALDRKGRVIGASRVVDLSACPS